MDPRRHSLNSIAMAGAAAVLEVIMYYLPSRSMRTTHSARAIFYQNALQHAISTSIYSLTHTSAYVYLCTYTQNTHTYTLHQMEWLCVFEIECTLCDINAKICRSPILLLTENYKLCTHPHEHTRSNTRNAYHNANYVLLYFFVRESFRFLWTSCRVLHQLAYGGGRGSDGI